MKKMLFIVIACIICFAGCGEKEKKVEPIQSDVEVQSESKDAEPNTSAMVDNIISKAREDAETATEEQKEEALEFIKNNIDDCTKDNEMMENIMYYGALLDYCYDDKTDISKIGTDSVQAVKYLYRGYTDEDEQSSKENIEQVKKGIENIS